MRMKMTQAATNVLPYRFTPPSNSVALAQNPDLQNKVILFPGVHGVPVRNFENLDKVIDIIKTGNICISWDMHFKIFDMENPDDVRLYEALHTAAACSRQHIWLHEYPSEGFGSTHWKIAIRWGEKYIEPPRRFMAADTKNPLGV
jgi:hypothetical protein